MGKEREREHYVAVVREGEPTEILGPVSEQRAVALAAELGGRHIDSPKLSPPNPNRKKRWLQGVGYHAIRPRGGPVGDDL